MNRNRFDRQETTLGFQSLPVLGGNRHADRARTWQRIAIALGGFWFAVGLALIGRACL